MPCPFKKPDGTICGAEVGMRSNGTPFVICRNCDMANKYKTNNFNTRQFPKPNVTFCNFVGNMVDTKLPYRCIATANDSGFCNYHSKPINNPVIVNNGTNNRVNITPAKPAVNNATKVESAKQNTPKDAKSDNKQVKNQLAKLDESDAENFGVEDVINKLKENKPATTTAESSKESSKTEQKTESSKKKSKKGGIIDDDETNIEPTVIDSEELDEIEDDEKTKKAAEKAAKKAAKAEALAKIAAKEAKKTAKAKKAAEKEDSSSSSESSVKKEDKKSKKSKK